MGTQLLLPKKGGTLPIFGPCLLWPNGWMDQDATWYEGRPRPRPHCVTWGPSSPSQKGHSPPIFGPCLLWPNGRPSQLLLSTCIIRSHCSSMYVDAVYCYRPSSVVCPSVCLSQQWALQQQLNRLRFCLGRGLRWAQETSIRWGPDAPWEGAIWGGKGRPIVSYRSSVQKWLTRSRHRLGFGLGWT